MAMRAREATAVVGAGSELRGGSVEARGGNRVLELSAEPTGARTPCRGDAVA